MKFLRTEGKRVMPQHCNYGENMMQLLLPIISKTLVYKLLAQTIIQRCLSNGYQ